MNINTITEFRKNKIFENYVFSSIYSGVLASFLILTFSLAICFVVIYSYPVAYKLDLQHPTLFFVSTLCSFGFWSISLGGIIIHTFYRYGLIQSKKFFEYVHQNILDISEFRELKENLKIQPTGFFQTLTVGFVEVLSYVGYFYLGIFALYVDVFANVIDIFKIMYDFSKFSFSFVGILAFGISFLGVILEIFKIIGLQYDFFKDPLISSLLLYNGIFWITLSSVLFLYFVYRLGKNN